MLPIGADDRRCVTASERYLAGLCERSFLRLWSHPNVFRKPHKELCDLLVVFGDDIVVFQDKSCHFADGPLAWERWHRRSISTARHQLHQSARWLRGYPDRVFLDRRCEIPFPFELPKRPRIHLVAVSLGATDACRSHYNEPSASLRIAPSMPGETPDPFHVNDPDRKADFVHVFDDVTLDLVMRELDTIDDFVSYLSAKERFCRSGQLIVADSEADLLAYYLTHIDPATGRHDFVLEPHTYIAVEEYWSGLSRRPEYKAKKREDEISFLWDRIIESTAHGVLSGTLVFPPAPELRHVEEQLRFLAREPRVARRSLSRAIFELWDATATHDRGFRHIRPVLRPEMSYVLAVIKRGTWCRSEEHYREQRLNTLAAYMDVARLRMPDAKVIVGLAFPGIDEDDGSVDCIANVFDEALTAEESLEIDALRARMGWRDANDLELIHATEREYPELTQAPRPRSRKRAVMKKRKESRRARKLARRRNR